VGVKSSRLDKEWTITAAICIFALIAVLSPLLQCGPR